MLSRFRRPAASAALSLAVCATVLAFSASPGSATIVRGGRLASSVAGAPPVTTSEGVVTGLLAGSERAYLGIPYAAPPVGPLRWEPPAPHAPWSAPLQATHFGPHCPQPVTPFGTVSITEDCLYLNVFMPAQGAERRGGRPVMVWFHGGAFTVGESDDYDPARLVARGVDVVTVNYRLGPLGFLAHPALDAEGHLFANYGLLDQQAALQWVKRNATVFGGNPRSVTIFGESAGGASVLSQIASPRAAGTFARSIIESGAYLNTPTRAAAEAAGTAYATAAGCADQSAACLRRLSVVQLLTHEAAAYQPVVDGTILPKNPKIAIADGAFNRVSVMNGSNAEEFRLFTALDFDLVTGPITAATYPGALAAEVGPVAAPLVLAQYPLANYPSPDLANSAALTDGSFACNALFLDRSLGRYVPTFGYEFADVNAPELFLPPVAFPYQAAHASEIQYLFDLESRFPQPLDAAQRRLAADMVSYWTNFAKVGIPYAAQTSTWPPFIRGLDDLLTLDTSRNAPTTGFAAEHECTFWDALLNPTAPVMREDARRPAVRVR